MKYKFFPVLFCACLQFLGASATVKLPSIFCDSMVLQRDKPVRIWGTAAPSEKVVVNFKNRNYQTRADAQGNWQVQLPAQSAGGPYTLQVNASNSITLKDVLFGDVWLCSGQSNMVHQLNIHDVTYADEIATANYPLIRQFWIPTLTNLQGPAKDLPKGSWTPAVGEQVRPFSAVAYFFAKQLFEKYHVPIGIINASVGGTPIEAWTSENGFKDFPDILKTIEKNKDTAYINGLSRRGFSGNTGGMNRQPADKGLSGINPWFTMAYEPKGWRNIYIPGYWEDQGIKNLDGVVWYRKEIDIPASMTGKAARVFLGRIVDADVLYINGKQVGATTYQYPQRRYNVPAGVLQAGKNLFVIKVTNSSGKGGFVPDKPYYIFSGKDTVSLSGNWQYKVGEAYDRRSRGDFAGGGGGINAQNQPTALYNAMVAPVVPYAVKGFVWYQGESNAGQPQQYEKLQRALIADWRNLWQEPNAPFLFVQLPNFMDVNYLPEESNWAMLREAQLKASDLPNTAMAVAIDAGEWNDIHPDNKQVVGERLALAAQKIAYGENIVYSGPVYESSKVEGENIIISFRHTGSGLVSHDGEDLSDFAIAGDDKKFVWAQAKIEGDKVIVHSEKVTQPKYVRYAWADNPMNPNLYNKEGLPASPFRTDN